MFLPRDGGVFPLVLLLASFSLISWVLHTSRSCGYSPPDDTTDFEYGIQERVISRSSKSTIVAKFRHRTPHQPFLGLARLHTCRRALSKKKKTKHPDSVQSTQDFPISNTTTTSQADETRGLIKLYKNAISVALQMRLRDKPTTPEGTDVLG